jgi:hypothetical protein
MNRTYTNTKLVNTANQTTTFLKPMNEERKNHGCTYFRKNGTDFILVAGGQDFGDLASSEILNLDTGEWEMVGDILLPRSGLRLALVEVGEVIVLDLDT